MVLISFKSFIPFPTPASIKKYLDDYNKQIISRIIDYNENIAPKQKLFTQNFNNINTNTNFSYIKDNDIIDKQLLIYNSPPIIPPPNYCLILFSISSLFMFLLTKKYF